MTKYEKVYKTSWNNHFRQIWIEVALYHFRLFQEFAEICMENHDLPSTKSKNFSFERPMMPVFFAKTCKTKITVAVSHLISNKTHVWAFISRQRIKIFQFCKKFLGSYEYDYNICPNKKKQFFFEKRGRAPLTFIMNFRK